jgi:hypothetical protein
MRKTREAKMEEDLRKIMLWAGHGTPRQFYYELVARLSDEGYEVELEGETLTVFKSHREGGFLGIGGRKIKEIFLELDYEGGEVSIDPESANAEVVSYLARALEAH